MPDKDPGAEWLDVAHDACQTMRTVSERLDIIAVRLAFFMPGSPAFEILRGTVRDLDKAADRLFESIGAKVAADVREAGQATDNMVMAALNALTMAKPKKE